MVGGPGLSVDTTLIPEYDGPEIGDNLNPITTTVLVPKNPEALEEIGDDALERANQKKRSLDEVEFPLSFLLCVHEMVHMTGRYKKLGYSNDWDFFTGKSRYNESIYGWGGHTENGSSYGSVEG